MATVELLIGKTFHKRFLPLNHHFSYPLLMVSVDIFKGLSYEQSILFGYNKWGLFSIYDTDHLFPGPESIQVKLNRFVGTIYPQNHITSATLYTIPRTIKRFFRPVSFYLITLDNHKTALIAEVSNTYHEMHLYWCEENSEKNLHFKADKHFHVSPFFDEIGQYEFDFKINKDSFFVGIRYFTNNALTFYADFKGQKKIVTLKNTLPVLVWTIIQSALVFPRILWQAFVLFYFKRLTAKSKPQPHHPNSIRVMPMNFFQTYSLNTLKKQLSKIDYGSLTLRVLGQDPIEFKGGKPGKSCVLEIHNPRFFYDIALKGEIGFGEAFIHNFWSTPSLTDLICFFIDNNDCFSKTVSPSFLINQVDRLSHWLNRNTPQKSPQNIEAHYDLSNAFFDFFLDKNKFYSSAIYQYPSQSLEEAQLHKVDVLIKKLQVKPHHHVLEIGSGWGGMAIALVQKTGCRVTTITLSKAQCEEAQERIKLAGLSENITVLLKDFRDIDGTFDRIISIEMLEAVGHSFLPDYFEKIDQCLSQNGVAVIQVITFPCYGYDAYRKGWDFIRKHIFPGGHLPSVSEITRVLSEHTTLIVQSLDNIGPHYAPTLKAWREHFLSQTENIKALGFDEIFIRKWVYYFAYCEAAFASRKLTNHHWVLTKPQNRDFVVEGLVN